MFDNMNYPKIDTCNFMCNNMRSPLLILLYTNLQVTIFAQFALFYMA